MHESQDLLSRDDLIAGATALGESITPHQLVRWHKKGLLRRPVVRHHGRGKGTTSYYPSSMLSQAVFLSRALRQTGRLDHATRLLWLAGFPVTAAFRVAFLGSLDESIRSSRRAMTDYENDNPANAIDRAENARFPKSLSKVPRVNRPMLQRLLTDFELGTFTLDNYGTEDLVELVGQMRQPAAGATISDAAQSDIREVVERELSTLSTVRLRETVARLSDGQLEADRSRVMQLWSALMEISSLLLPLPEALFCWTLKVRRVSPTLRALLRDARRGMHARGYTSFREAMHDAAKHSRQ
jgi:hypothetical protein